MTMLRAGDPAAKSVRNLEEFRRAVNSSFVPLLIDARDDDRFQASLSATSADGVEFTEVDAAPQLVQRTPGTIASGGAGHYKFSLLLSGSSVLIQDGRETVMHAGDLTFYDTSRPYSLLFDEDFRNLIMMFPKDRLPLPAHLGDSLTAVSLGAEHALAPQIISLLTRASADARTLTASARTLTTARPTPTATPQTLTSPVRRLPTSQRTPAAAPRTLTATERTLLAQTGIGLIGSMLTDVLDVDAAVDDPHRALRARIRAHIDDHLGDHDLTPGSIAAAHFISVRHLHGLFADQGTTVSALIRARRLERARVDLGNPALATRTVAAIAARWGFVDAAHFSRAFKQEFGISPREQRRAGERQWRLLTAPGV